MTNPSERPAGSDRGDRSRRPIASAWALGEARGEAGALHAVGVPASPSRSVEVLDVTTPALVLGSAQPWSDADHDACAVSAVAVVRRRSGGGAVLLEPGRVLWVDLVVPAGDPVWSDDVGRAFVWLGRAWASALAAAGVPGATVHEGPLVQTRWSRQVCFAGLGPGEVTVGGRKVVGMSQRRSRAGARFQCAVPLAWDAEHLVSLLALPEADRMQAITDLAAAVHPVADVDPRELLAALVEALPA